MLLSSSALLTNSRRYGLLALRQNNVLAARRGILGTASFSSTPLLRQTLGTTTPRLSRGATATALFAACCGVGQYYYGNEKDFYDYRFITDKDPDDLAGFYGGESFMEIFCVMPFMGTLMMRGGQFDEEGTIHTTGFPAGDMQVSMVFSDEENEETGQTKWFNKRERFKNVILGYTCWDMVTNFGFERLPDGRVMVYHHGEYFHGSLVPFSLLVRLVFGIHARWVAWATEHHINHYAFTEEEGKEEEWEEESRADMPLFLLKNYAWSDLTAGLFGRQIKKPSFMLEQAAGTTGISTSSSPEHIILSDLDEGRLDVLPIKRSNIRRHITTDIAIDRKNSKLRLLEIVNGKEDRGSPLNLEKGTAIQSDIALHRRITTISRRALTNKTSEKFDDQVKDEHIQRRSSLTKENLGGPAAWELLRSTKNPDVYVAATFAARQRHSQRRQSLRPAEDADFNREGRLFRQPNNEKQIDIHDAANKSNTY